MNRAVLCAAIAIVVGTDAAAAPKSADKGVAEPSVAPVVDPRYQQVAPLDAFELHEVLTKPGHEPKAEPKPKASKSAPDEAAEGELRVGELLLARGGRCGEAVEISVRLFGGVGGGSYVLRAVQTQGDDRLRALRWFFAAHNVRWSEPSGPAEVSVVGDLEPGERRTVQLATPWRFGCHGILPEGSYVANMLALPSYIVMLNTGPGGQSLRRHILAPREVRFEARDYSEWFAESAAAGR